NRQQRNETNSAKERNESGLQRETLTRRGELGSLPNSLFAGERPSSSTFEIPMALQVQPRDIGQKQPKGCCPYPTSIRSMLLLCWLGKGDLACCVLRMGRLLLFPDG